jgi:hypothetical protein
VVLPVATVLQRAGAWSSALAATRNPGLRAEILVDRCLWRGEPPDDALEAIGAIRGQPLPVAFLQNLIVYWQKRRKPGSPGEPIEGLAAVAEEATGDLHAWAVFWHATALQRVGHKWSEAGEGYERVRQLAVASGDRLLESYALRAQGQQLRGNDDASAIQQLRRSLYLRAVCGARPHVIDAQLALAGALQKSGEAQELQRIAKEAAFELRLTPTLDKHGYP